MTQHSGNLHSATCFVACSCRQKNLQTGSSTKITQNQVTKLRPDDVISIQVNNFGRILTCDKAEICILQLVLFPTCTCGKKFAPGFVSSKIAFFATCTLPQVNIHQKFSIASSPLLRSNFLALFRPLFQLRGGQKPPKSHLTSSKNELELR